MWRAMRAAVHAWVRPLSMSSRDICAREAASSILASCRWQFLMPSRIAQHAGSRGAAARAASTRSWASGERVEYLLHVLVLLELVDERKSLGRLLFRQLDRLKAEVLVQRGERRDAARLERFLQLAEVCKCAADDELRLAFVARRLAHLLKLMIDEVELKFILINARGRKAKHAHLLEEETHAAVGGELAAIFTDDVTHAGNGSCRVVGRGFDEQRDAMRRIPLVDHFLIQSRIAAGGAFDRRLDLIFRHVDGARILDVAP